MATTIATVQSHSRRYLGDANSEEASAMAPDSYGTRATGLEASESWDPPAFG